MFATVNDIEISYDIQGTGLPCLVPRALNTSIMERALSPRLRDHLRCIFFDMRGSGQSGGTPGDFTLEQLLADLDGLRAALGYDQVAMLGWSMVSLLAIDYAFAYPTRVSHLILVGGLTHFGDDDDRYWEMVASDERKALLARNLAALDQEALAAISPGRAAPILYAANGPRYWYDATFDCRSLYGEDDWDVTFAGRLVQELQQRHPVPTVIEGIATPIFLAQGVWDFVCPAISWYEVMQTFPTCSYHAFERSGPYPFYEEQDKFDDTLIDWLTAG